MDTNEALQKASDSARFLCDDLQAAYANADPISAMILEVQHENAVALRDAIARLLNAREYADVTQ